METAENLKTLAEMPIGGRLVVRSQKDWRFASIACISEGTVTISVASASGRTYRIRRNTDTEIVVEGLIPLLMADESDHWLDNFSVYDSRW